MLARGRRVSADADYVAKKRRLLVDQDLTNLIELDAKPQQKRSPPAPTACHPTSVA